MAHLLRIVMIHGHLEGVVELDVDGHTNICGTNASGKTTLQRLVPVFYGELPNKVVPKTRKKFDAFYLPHGNSYLIYEYRREAGNVCQAVLTRKSDGGIEYRFIGAPYQPGHYLVEANGGVTALGYSDWASQLRRDNVPMSAKLTATSEYRAVIQNDFTHQQGNRKDSLRLRQMAAQFSLVKPERRIRHMEKLISAVHAKEGKMDTLKTMLAAIFEEDGVELPVTRIRSTKAREWIAQMRQSKRLEPLERALAKLDELDHEVAERETILWQLKPQLEADRHRAERTLADTEAEIARRKQEFQEREAEYGHLRDALNDRLSEMTSELEQTQRELSDLQDTFEAFEEADMPALERDVQSLPQWRDQSQQLREHLAVMQSAFQEHQSRLEGRLRELADELARQQEEAQARIDELGETREELRNQQWQQQSELEQRYQSQRQELDDSYRERLDAGLQRVAELKAQLSASAATAEEMQEAELAQARLDQAQSDRDASGETLSALREEYDTLKRSRDQAEQELNDARHQLAKAEAHCHALHQQRDPAQGTLRHFLRYHRPGWEQRLGKVIAPELLERRDLSPKVGEHDHDELFGVGLDLAAVDVPEYAQDEASLVVAIEQAEAALVRAENAEQAAERQMKACNERVQSAEDAVRRARMEVKRAESEVDYARDARSQLQERHGRQQKTRRQALEESLAAQQASHDDLKQEKGDALDTLAKTHQAQLLEVKADAQSRLDGIDDQIRQHKQYLSDQKQEHQRQRQELEAAFDRELQEQGVDLDSLRDTKARLAALDQRIRDTAGRQEQLEDYRRFMRLDWGQRKPQLVEKETRLIRDKETAEREREQRKAEFQSARSAHQQALAELSTRRSTESGIIDALKPLLVQVEQLPLDPAPAPQSQAPGDVHERIERAHRALSERATEMDALRKGCEQVEGELIKGASAGFIDTLSAERDKLRDELQGSADVGPRQLLPLLRGMLTLLEDQQQQLVQQGRNLGADLDKFFTVFRDLNRRISAQSRRLSEEVADDLRLEGITKAEVKIQSTIDELGFWEPLKRFAQDYRDWQDAGGLPGDDYLNALADVVDLLRSDQQYSFESLLRLELHLNEGGTDLVIKNDRQLLESSSHGMAYLILCKFLLAFTRLLRGQAEISVHWPIDEIGTLAYHNVEKLFEACDSNHIHIVGAFPNPESDVLLLFHNRYLIDRDANDPRRRRLKRIEPRLSKLAQRLKQRSEEELTL